MTWPLHFVLSISVGSLMIIVAYITGAFESTEDELALRIFNGAIAMPVFIVYGWICIAWLQYKTRHCFEQLIGEHLPESAFGECDRFLSRTLSANLVRAVLLGFLTMFLYLYSEDLFAENLEPALLLMNIYAVPFWAVVFLLTMQLYATTGFVIQRFLSHEKIDLFGLKKIQPISDLVIANTFVATFALALIPLFWMGRSVPDIDKVIIVVAFIIITFYLFLPVLQVQTVIARKKRLAISRINQSFLGLFDSKQVQNRRLVDDPIRLRKLSSLISAKQEISGSSEWLLTLPQSIKSVVISASIPASWAAASYVESFIATFFK